ncbi:MAG TPA: ribosome silencing factor [Cyanobacteria bacterium UBA11149]|nr:ribosome silencing factor [Cyanobacteria bacterium UBA11367]HBE57347.1 ribosome silencing factor [Cyanobacteria bacterium UBA11366]HBS70791.1 ribosome silencing factor [Cyanobacteria bacterium UBA11153]HBW91508.1 ribosome silencing factor [Cyanobacteria bacterium UBA11149]HCA94621.1 ribosome silencing factor [Cyanobacteria bacterium UBA9226]
MKDQQTMQSTLLTPPNQYQKTSQELALTIAQLADDRKGDNIVILRVAEVSYIADYFVIVTGFSRIQVRAIQGWIEEEVEKLCQRLPIRTEGQADSSWILQDYGDVMVHIMLPQEREFYNLEAFWGHAERIEIIAVDS